MFLLRTFQLGLKSLLLHPLRSLLTVLGIFIGVASVIWLLAIGEGISQEAQRQIQDLGATNVIVRSVKPPAEVTAGFTGAVEYGLKYEDYNKLLKTLPSVEAILPIREVRRSFTFEGKDVDGRLVASTPGYADVMRLTVDRGRYLTEADENDAKNYCVLSKGVADILFGGKDAIGRDIYMAESKDYYQVVGILKHRPPMAGIGGSLDAQDFQGDVYVPMATLKQRIGSLVVTRRGSQFSAEKVELSQVTLRVKQLPDSQATADLVRETADLVRATFGVKNESPNPANSSGKMPVAVTKISTESAPTPSRRDVAVIVPEELLEQARVTRMMFMMFMGLIAAISLLVGGIGIMNIMLATVTERTREIGIRRALGATQSHIIWQFLVETITLSIVGGITGILGGLLCPWTLEKLRWAFGYFAPKLMANLPEVVHRLKPEIVWGSLPLAFGISVLVGVVFGIYPAFRAAKMDPIEALRHE